MLGGYCCAVLVLYQSVSISLIIITTVLRLDGFPVVVVVVVREHQQ